MVGRVDTAGSAAQTPVKQHITMVLEKILIIHIFFICGVSQSKCLK
mgnify:CR=1 FL=1